MTAWLQRASLGYGGHPPWVWLVAFSVALHGGVFLGIWWMERYSPTRASVPMAISVRLVKASPGQISTVSKPPPPAKDPSTQSPKVNIRRPIPRADRKLVSIRPPDVKIPERKMAKPKPAEQAEPPRPAGRTETEAAPPENPQTPGGGGVRLTSEETRYLSMLQERIEENWRAYLPQESGVLGEVRIQIAANGQIREFAFLKGSGKAHVDASITRAIKKTVLPPPPRSLTDRELVLRFWPSGPQM